MPIATLGTQASYLGTVARKLRRLIWMILRKGMHYDERGPALSERSTRVGTDRMIRVLRKQAAKSKHQSFNRVPLGNFRGCYEQVVRTS